MTKTKGGDKRVNPTPIKYIGLQSGMGLILVFCCFGALLFHCSFNMFSEMLNTILLISNVKKHDEQSHSFSFTIKYFICPVLTVFLSVYQIKCPN